MKVWQLKFRSWNPCKKSTDVVSTIWKPGSSQASQLESAGQQQKQKTQLSKAGESQHVKVVFSPLHTPLHRHAHVHTYVQ